MPKPIVTWPDPLSLGFMWNETFSMETSPDLSAWSLSTSSAAPIGGDYVVTNSITGYLCSPIGCASGVPVLWNEGLCFPR